MKNTKIIDKKCLIQKYIVENKTTTEIANELNCSPTKIGNTLIKYKIPRKKSGPRKGN